MFCEGQQWKGLSAADAIAIDCFAKAAAAKGGCMRAALHAVYATLFSSECNDPAFCLAADMSIARERESVFFTLFLPAKLS